MSFPHEDPEGRCLKSGGSIHLKSEVAAELERVLDSQAFRSSQRAQRLLRHLIERTLAGDPEGLRERTLGIEVFGRDSDYDTTRDAIVRVAANDVRKRLIQYYTDRNSEDSPGSVKIGLHAGSYIPEFCQVAAEHRKSLQLAEKPGALRWRGRWTMVVLALAGVSVVALALWIRAAVSERAGEAMPTVDLFWSQMFPRGRRACLVLSDANLTVFQPMLHRSLTLREYSSRDFNSILTRELASAEQRQFAGVLMGPRYFTCVADSDMALKVGALNRAHHVETDLVFARDFEVQYFDTDNVILLGSQRANPWLGLFEPQLNFQTVYQEEPQMAFLKNVAPQRGEPEVYTGRWQVMGFCRVAFLPNLKRNGNVLIISGTEMLSTLAGGEFITSERWLQRFRGMLGQQARERFPYFEVLLRAQLVTQSAPKMEIVAYRVGARLN
jgi:hypothetical protein